MPKNLDFNDQVGFDVLEIPSWEHGIQKIKAASCLDHGTKFQIVSPLLEGEKGKSLRKAYVSSWKKWARPPRRLVCDPAKQNVAPALADPLERESTQIDQVASEAQWQNGDTEVHGGWWRRIFTKTLESVQPVDQDEWLECIGATNEAKNVLIRTSGYSPYRHVFGRDPVPPGDLLQTNPDVVSATMPLYDDTAARAQQIRHAARLAVLETQDDRAMRLALAARPRLRREFQSGNRVRYWRKQLGSREAQGYRTKHARWHGRAVVVGKHVSNLWVTHRNTFLRCAPGQLRLATPEETMGDEQVDEVLRRTRDLLSDAGGPQRGFIDLSKEEMPPNLESVVDIASRAATSADESTENTAPALDPVTPVPTVSQHLPLRRLSTKTTPSEMPIPDQPASSSSSPPTDSTIRSERDHSRECSRERLSRPSAVRDGDIMELTQDLESNASTDITRPASS